MAAITLTPQDGSASVVVNTNIIYRVFAYGTGSRVMYGKGGANPYIMDVTAAPAAIVDSALGLIEVATSNGTEYIYAGNSANGDGKGIMMVNTNGTGSIIFFKYTEQSAPIYIYSTDSQSTIAARMNALMTFPPTTFAVSETITATGALAPAKMVSYLNTTSGAQALTLADGSYVGQTKIVTVTVFGTGNNAVLTPAHLASPYTTITFNSLGDTISLVWGGSSWLIGGNQGCVLA